MKNRKINPGESEILDFIVDTRGKIGLIEKSITIHTNELESPHKVVFHFHALPRGMEGTDTQAVFTPPCSNCHLNPGIGKQSKELFEAVCAMCHTEGIKTDEASSLHQWIAQGNKQIGMPSYENHLTESQINSLIEFLSKQEKQ